MSKENELCFDINDISEKTTEFENKFLALTMIGTNNKVGVDSNGNLYAEYFTQPYIMAVIRKITGQKREDINEYLNTNFNEYESFLLFVINAYESSEHLDKQKLNNIINTHKIICVGLVSGLTNLKTSYPDYLPILETCNTYIDKFNLFRTKSNNLIVPFSD